MIDYEATLLTLYTEADGMQRLIEEGLNDENVAVVLGDDALVVWQTARQWFRSQAQAVPMEWLMEKHEPYILNKQDSGDVLDHPDPREIVRAIKTRYLQQTYKARIAEERFDLSEPVDVSQMKALNLARDLLKIAIASSPERPLEPMADRMEEYVEGNLNYWTRIEKGLESRPLTFGFDMVNEQYQGIRPGEVAVMAAYLKIGKSFIACKQALAAAMDGRTVALWTLENSEDEMFSRLTALAGELSYEHVNQRTLPPGEQRDRFKALVGEDVFERLYVKRPVTMEASSLEEIYWQSRDVGAELVVGDQLSHVYYPGEKKGDPDWLNEHKKMLMIASLSKQTKIASIWVHQLNRGAHNKTDPDSTNMARSLGIAQAADFVFYLSDPTKGAGPIRKLSCATTRRGPTMKWELRFDYDPMKIEAVRVWDD